MKVLWLSPIVLELSCWRLANSGSPSSPCDVICQVWPCSVLPELCHGLKAGRFRLKASGMLKFYCQDEVLGLRLYLRSKWLSPSGLWSKACWVLSPGSQGYSHVDSTKPQTCWRIRCPHMAVSLPVLSMMLPRCLLYLSQPTQQLLTPVCPQPRLGMDRVPLQCLCIEHKMPWYTFGVRLRGREGSI